MSELRQNMATREWVLIASERARRPKEFVEHDHVQSHQLAPYDRACPFCPGNEKETSTELAREPLDPARPWQWRLFSNRYPALEGSGARVQSQEGVHRKLSGVGFHEVLVETPYHNQSSAQLSIAQIHSTLRGYQARGREMMADPRIEQIMFFKNHGIHAGSTLRHAHGQLVALPMVPHTLRRRIEDLRRVFDDEGQCPHCRMLRIELAEQARLIVQNGSFVAFVPYAALSPFHVWILPRRHGPTFLDQTALELLHLAEVLRTVLAKLYAGLNDPDYNYIIHTAPVRDSSSAYLHWYLSVIPRVTRDAGFELGTGMYINPALPEESAAFLRDQHIEPASDQADVPHFDAPPAHGPIGGVRYARDPSETQPNPARIVSVADWREEP